MPKVVVRRNFIAVLILKKRSHTSNLTSQHKQLEKQEQSKPKASTKKEVIN